MNKHRLITILALTAVLFGGCGRVQEIPETETTEAHAAGDPVEESRSAYIYYLHTDEDCREIWERLGETFSRRSGIPVRIEYVEEKDYAIRLQQVMAKQEMPTAFFLQDADGAYAWDDYTTDLSQTYLGEKVRYPSEYFYYCGKAAGIPDRVSPDRNYVAFNAQADEDSLEATEKFFSWIFCSAEGRCSFPNRGYADCYR